MSNPSNLYAEKIYAEHPMAFWALDDQADYITLLSDYSRDLTTWKDPINGTVSHHLVDSDAPFPESPVTKITGGLVESEFGQVVCISQDITNFSSLNKDLSTFSIGAFINSISVYGYSFEIGYEYDDTISGSTIQRLKTFVSSVQDRWVFVSETFDTPDENTSFRIVIKINYIAQGNNLDDYEFLVMELLLVNGQKNLTHHLLAYLEVFYQTAYLLSQPLELRQVPMVVKIKKDITLYLMKASWQRILESQ